MKRLREFLKIRMFSYGDLFALATLFGWLSIVLISYLVFSAWWWLIAFLLCSVFGFFMTFYTRKPEEVDEIIRLMKETEIIDR